MSNTKHLFLLALLACAFTLSAQNPYDDSLCYFTWESSINNCPDPIICIDPQEWEAKVISVPANISRISPDSLKLCMGDLHLVTPVDITYIMDLSRSMITTYTPSGDPYKKRDDALRAGFQFQIDSLKESHAGYIGFGSTLPTAHQLTPRNVITGQTDLIGIADMLQTYVDNDQHDDGTDYEIAMNQAVSWLQNTTYCPHDIKAIIFISDGEPNQGASWVFSQQQYLIDNNIEVHGVFLGTTMGTALQNLATNTNGSSTLVPQTNSDTLATVVENIVSTYIDEIVAEEVTLINATTVDTATSIAEYEVNDTVWTVKMDNYIPLKSGLNEVTVNSIFRSVGGYDNTLEFTFYLDLQDTVTYTSECYSCWNRTRLEVEYFPPGRIRFNDTLPYNTDGYALKLFYYDTDTINQPEIIVSTEISKDCDTIVLNNRSWNGIECLFIDSVSLRISAEPATPGNGITEPFFDDTIYFSWNHHKDFLDTIAHSTLTIVPYYRILKIYDSIGDPSLLIPYKMAPESTTVSAGDTVDLFAKVFTGTTWLSNYETDPLFGKQITWSFVDVETNQQDTSIGILLSDSSNYNEFYCKKARKCVDVTASMTAAGMVSHYSVRLVTLPGTAKQLVIEATKDSTVTDLFNPAPFNPITMYNNQASKKAFGILRDIEGNWIGPATDATWTSDSTPIVTVSAGPSEIVTISKGTAPTGQTTINAQQAVGGTTLTGSSTVSVLTYGIDSLRIVSSVNSAYQDVIQLQMEVTVDTTLLALGRRTDNGTWVLLNVAWGINPVVTADTPPANSDRWLVKPDGSSASGKISITYSSGAAALSDTTNFEFGTMAIENCVSLKKQKFTILHKTGRHGTIIQILLSNPIKEIEASLMSLNGKMISQYRSGNTREIRLDIPSAANGLYLLRLKSDNEVLLRKFNIIR